MTFFVRMNILFSMLFACLLVGCSRPTTPAASNGFDTQTSDPSTGVIIRTRLATNEIGIADRLMITVDIEWVSPISVQLVEPDWDTNAWDLVEVFQEPVKHTGNSFVKTTSYVLEPFLAGDYVSPIFTASILSNPNAPKLFLASMTTPIRVVSALDEQDSGLLQPPNGFIDPTLETSVNNHSSTPTLIGVGVLMLGILVIFWYRLKTNPQATPHASAYEQIVHVASGSDDSIAQAYDALYQALNKLDKQLQQTSEIGRFIQECERARFSDGHSDTLDPKAMAKHTLELLGNTNQGDL